VTKTPTVLFDKERSTLKNVIEVKLLLLACLSVGLLLIFWLMFEFKTHQVEKDSLPKVMEQQGLVI
jgi:hypothetical protein